jgi:hypothetical protein
MMRMMGRRERIGWRFLGIGEAWGV